MCLLSKVSESKVLEVSEKIAAKGAQMYVEEIVSILNRTATRT
jgi:hypothetical protein